MLPVMQKSGKFLKNLERFRLVTFDVTDTLLKFKTTPTIQYAKTAAALGVQNIDQQRLSECFRQEFKSMAQLYPNFGCKTEDMSWQEWWLKLVCKIFHCVDPEIPTEKLNEIARTLLWQYRTDECWAHVQGATELVQKVKDSGKYVGIISNFDPSLRQILDAMKMHNFDFVLTSYDCGVQKPSTKIFQIPLKNLNISANQALHIGNLYDVDYMGARRSGWSSLLITKDQTTAIEINKSHVYSKMSDVLDALETNEIHW